MPPASNRNARVIIYGLILAITSAITATAITTVVRADSNHGRHAPPATAVHKHNSPGPPAAGGPGSRVLLIATTQRLPRFPQDLRETSRAKPPPQSQRHAHNEHAHGVRNGAHKVKR